MFETLGDYISLKLTKFQPLKIGQNHPKRSYFINCNQIKFLGAVSCRDGTYLAAKVKNPIVDCFFHGLKWLSKMRKMVFNPERCGFSIAMLIDVKMRETVSIFFSVFEPTVFCWRMISSVKTWGPRQMKGCTMFKTSPCCCAWYTRVLVMT